MCKSFSLFSKQHNLGYSLPMASWSAIEISNDRTPEGTQGPGDLHS